MKNIVTKTYVRRFKKYIRRAYVNAKINYEEHFQALSTHKRGMFIQLCFLPPIEVLSQFWCKVFTN